MNLDFSVQHILRMVIIQLGLQWTFQLEPMSFNTIFNSFGYWILSYIVHIYISMVIRVIHQEFESHIQMSIKSGTFRLL